MDIISTSEMCAKKKGKEKRKREKERLQFNIDCSFLRNRNYQFTTSESNVLHYFVT